MRVLITAATVAEWMPSFLEMNNLYTSESQRLMIRFHQGGVGMPSTTVSLTKFIWAEKPDLIIQAGIARSFYTSVPYGKVVILSVETTGALGGDDDGTGKPFFDHKL